jgi:hypothetical protein
MQKDRRNHEIRESEMTASQIEIRTESRGSYWLAWLEADGKGPLDAVVVVGQTEDEARARAEDYRGRRARPDPAAAG